MIIGIHVKIVRWPLKKEIRMTVAIWKKMCHKKLQIMHCLNKMRLMQNETQDFEAWSFDNECLAITALNCSFLTILQSAASKSDVNPSLSTSFIFAID